MVALGVMIEGQEGLTWDRWERLIDAVDHLGFDSIWRSDHLISTVTTEPRAALALWPALSIVPERSARLAFGQLVSPITFRHPVMLAQNAIALDHLSGGRYHLGVGAGWNVEEHAMFGFELPPMRERLDRLEEALEVITRLWSGEPVTFDGNYYRLSGARLVPPPVHGRVPIVIGGSGEKRLLRIVARFADEWNVITMSPETYAHKSDVLDQHCRDIGRDPSTIRRSCMLAHVIGRDDHELRERVARLQQIMPNIGTGAPEQLLRELQARGWLVGTPDAIVEQIAARRALGVDRIMLQTFDQEDLDALTLFARHVLPSVA